MPIKVRCKECSTVLTVSDKAAGKAVKCKSCGGRVPVPAGGGGVKKKKRRRPPEQPVFDAPDDADDMFGGLDLRRAEDHSQKVCPRCTQPVDDEDIECPNCGVNIDTGALSVEQKERRSRKGPPPEEFYGKLWPNAWKFLMAHKSYAFKTGFLWGMSATMVIIAAFVLSWYTRTRAIELRESAEGDVTITETGVLIKPIDDGVAMYDGTKYSTGSTLLVNGQLELPTPEVAAMFAPPTFFWAFIFLVFLLSFGGWAFTLCGKIVELTMAKQKKIKRFHGDMYGNMTTGFTSLFWPIVLMYPVIWIPIAMHFAGVADNVCVITFVILFLIPYLVFLPIAVVHRSQPYSYRSWLITWMFKDLVNTLVPTLWVSAIFFGVVLLVPLGIAVGIAVGWEQFSDFYINRMEVPALSSMVGYSLKDADLTGSFTFYRMPFMFVVAFTTCTAFFTLLAFPAVFMMRVFGLYGLYFRPDLDLCVEQVPLSPAGFGPRFLAIQVDLIILAAMAAVSFKGAGLVSGLVQHLYNSEQIGNIAYWAAVVIAITASFGFYFANWESGSGRATLGKWTFGLMVLQEDNRPMPFNLALKRFFVSLLSVVSLSGTFIMCAFHPDHRAAHDLITKTKVLWRGDEDM